MPAMTIVTFTDAEGDEFPIGLAGSYETTYGDSKAVEAARRKLGDLALQKVLAPTWPLKEARVQYR